MKKVYKKLIVLLLVLGFWALLIFPVGKPFELPFEAEEVSSVVLWTFWGYKEAREESDIALIVEEMNNARLCGEFEFENYEPNEGDYSCSACFFLKDGSTYEYETMLKPGLTSIFRDADGTYYKAKNISLEKIYNRLNLELQPGNPFQ